MCTKPAGEILSAHSCGIFITIHLNLINRNTDEKPGMRLVVSEGLRALFVDDGQLFIVLQRIVESKSAIGPKIFRCMRTDRYLDIQNFETSLTFMDFFSQPLI